MLTPTHLAMLALALGFVPGLMVMLMTGFGMGLFAGYSLRQRGRVRRMSLPTVGWLGQNAGVIAARFLKELRHDPEQAIAAWEALHDSITAVMLDWLEEDEDERGPLVQPLLRPHLALVEEGVVDEALEETVDLPDLAPPSPVLPPADDS